MIEAASRAAALVDATVLIVGLNQSFEAEDQDRLNLSLPGNQEKLVLEVVNAAGTCNSGYNVSSVNSTQSIDISTVDCPSLRMHVIVELTNNGSTIGSHVLLVFVKPPNMVGLGGLPNIQLVDFKRTKVESGKRKDTTTTKCYGMKDQGTMVALLNETFFYDDRCGLKALVVYGGSVRVKIVGVCPPSLCDENTNLALSTETFSQIADPAAGKIFVDYAT
ncbi:hypothetical protein RJ640_025039 [Escallonia rubra]|uniref:Uncharacterized protein n=1 Tax=Escallonia rubra TaxID=112253 RepID=A0AA88R4R9_9ASTE|nr:hypothetical protein RJ640_025039 [Escallonia rubra]